MGRASHEDRYGTQSIERAIALLREVSTRGNGGWQMSDLAARSRLGKSTVHRILACLVRERLLVQRTGDRHYLPGPMLFELGLALPGLTELQCVARGRLIELAKQTGGAAFLLLRSGDDFVCAARAGLRDQKSLTIYRGSRRPLITSVGGAAILLELPRAEAHGIIRRNLTQLRESGMGEDRIQATRALLKRSYAERFALNEGYLVAGNNAFGMALRDAQGHPFASVSVAGPSSVLSMDRFQEIRGHLQSTINDLQDESPRPVAERLQA